MTFSQSHLPPDSAFTAHRRLQTTTLLAGPYEACDVMTANGTVTCEGPFFLAIDARGYPYPIATEEVIANYRPVDDGWAVSPQGVRVTLVEKLGGAEATVEFAHEERDERIAVVRFGDGLERWTRVQPDSIDNMARSAVGKVLG